ncbi:MAG: long-chain fatty acid--CoA ligase [Flavobacteriaceae bacterium]|nr:long-chain fatty acid--CoA ligase [Flavobacteriaceae bacterium]
MNSTTRLFDILENQVKNKPLKRALNTKYNGVWESTSSKEFLEKSNQISRGLLQLGVKKGDKVAIISSNNRTEWCIVDIGVLQIGAIDVPIYPTITAEDYSYIINHSESKYCFVSDVVVYEKIKSIQNECPNLKEIYCFDTIKGCKHWSAVLELGKDAAHQSKVLAIKESVNPQDLATIIYTSGTTGTPKGVMLSHNNIVSNVIAAQKRLPLDKGKAVALSFLPLCHIYERMLMYLYQLSATEVHFAESLETIGENLNEVNPDVMTAVPRLLEKLYDKIYGKGQTLTGIKKKLFNWAVNVGLDYEPYGKNGVGYSIKLFIARALIFKKWKSALGGNLKLIASGSAALQPRLARVFTAAGLTVVEGYGLTETSPVISVNDMRDGKFRVGSVGQVVENVKVKIADDGEILCKGPNIMMGYYKNQKLTDEVIKDGYFHTGDIGHIDDDGFLKITDRKKEMFKTSGGKYVAPQVIENIVKQSTLIDQVMVVGESQKYPAALIQLNFDAVNEWLGQTDIPLNYTEMVANEKVLNKIKKDIDQANENFAQWEKIKKFKLTPEIWSVDSGHLTPTMKLKRKIIKSKYQDLLEEIYS